MIRGVGRGRDIVPVLKFSIGAMGLIGKNWLDRGIGELGGRDMGKINVNCGGGLGIWENMVGLWGKVGKGRFEFGIGFLE